MSCTIGVNHNIGYDILDMVLWCRSEERTLLLFKQDETNKRGKTEYPVHPNMFEQSKRTGRSLNTTHFTKM